MSDTYITIRSEVSSLRSIRGWSQTVLNISFSPGVGGEGVRGKFENTILLIVEDCLHQLKEKNIQIRATQRNHSVPQAPLKDKKLAHTLYLIFK